MLEYHYHYHWLRWLPRYYVSNHNHNHNLPKGLVMVWGLGEVSLKRRCSVVAVEK
jgi:hypothetical protein